MQQQIVFSKEEWDNFHWYLASELISIMNQHGATLSITDNDNKPIIDRQLYLSLEFQSILKNKLENNHARDTKRT